jgi:hypothetical protein
MASPLFLSYAWSDESEANRLDTLLRLRGVPVWRDRRAMRWGGYQQDEVRKAIGEICSGFAIHLTPAALDQNGSRFITEVELPAMDDRRRADHDFFSGAVFDGYDLATGTEAVQSLCGFSVGATFGSVIDSTTAPESQLRASATAILRSYLATLSGDALEIFFDTRQELPYREPAAIHLGWHPPLAHDLACVEPDVWNRDLLPALADLNGAIRSIRAPTHLVVSGQPHLSAAFALGHVFRTPGPWSLELVGYNGQRWRSGPRLPEAPGWELTPQAGGTGPGSEALLVCLHATHQVSNAVRAARRNFPPPRATIDIFPPTGPAHDSIDPDAANGLAAMIAAEIARARARYGAEETHLYMACPWPFAALLGHHLASSGPVVSFEANLDRDNYYRACRLA